MEDELKNPGVHSASEAEDLPSGPNTQDLSPTKERESNSPQTLMESQRSQDDESASDSEPNPDDVRICIKIFEFIKESLERLNNANDRQRLNSIGLRVREEMEEFCNESMSMLSGGTYEWDFCACLELINGCIQDK